MKTNNHSEIGWHMILGAIVFLMLVPIVFALSNSFKTLQDAFNTIFEIIPSHPTLENYRHVFEKLPFIQITLNTFLIAASVTTFKTITSLFAAYSFVYFDYKGKQFFYFIMLSTMFIPFTVTMIPNYLMISKLGLRDCIWGVALPQFADVLGIFLLRQAMPEHLQEHLTDAPVYVHVWDALMRLQDVLPRAFMYYGKMQVNGQETGSEELGIFLPLRHFGDAMERNIEQADGIALGFREEMERYVRSV